MIFQNPLFLCQWCLILSVSTSHGILFQHTSDPQFNTQPPPGELVGSGWDLQGKWGSFLGTPVAPNFFITAKHVGGQIGASFEFRGVFYTTDARFNDPDSDLALWRITGNFPAHATLYSHSDEVGNSIVVFGRGGLRGVEVAASTALGPLLRGWRWGAADGRIRWGENVVDSVVTSDETIVVLPQVSAPANTPLLKMGFNRNGGTNEAHLSSGDSGGGVFIRRDNVWKLAGINYAVDGLYNLTSSGPGFLGAIFDEGSLYKGEATNWTFVPDFPTEQPSSFYATRISARVPWIQSVLSTNISQIQLQSANSLSEEFFIDFEAQVNSTNKTIRVAITEAQRFYRIAGPASFRITEVRKDGQALLMTYE